MINKIKTRLIRISIYVKLMKPWSWIPLWIGALFHVGVWNCNAFIGRFSMFGTFRTFSIICYTHTSSISNFFHI